MKLTTITISGANEHTDIRELVDLVYKYPKAEIGVQFSPAKAAYNSERYKWIEMLHDYALTLRQNVNVALHVNPGWVEEVCDGLLPLEMLRIMGLKNPNGGYFVKRIQLNFLIGRDKMPDMEKLHWVMSKIHHYKFILTYNEANRQFIDRFYFRYGPCFDLLCDESHGEGVTATVYKPSIYSDVFQGYSGGLSPDDIERVLTKIALANVGTTPIWIDAEGKLKGSDGHLDLQRAETFLAKASKW